MSKLLFAALAASLAFSTAAYAASEADCKAMWEKADMNKDGALATTESATYMTAMTGAGVKPKDAEKITAEEFMAECAKGTFDKMQ